MACFPIFRSSSVSMGKVYMTPRTIKDYQGLAGVIRGYPGYYSYQRAIQGDRTPSNGADIIDTSIFALPVYVYIYVYPCVHTVALELILGIHIHTPSNSSLNPTSNPINPKSRNPITPSASNSENSSNSASSGGSMSQDSPNSSKVSGPKVRARGHLATDAFDTLSYESQRPFRALAFEHFVKHDLPPQV